ncbi:hypothetical protein B0I32_127185 [Nonomuraea fuscirosea]|uniref:Uncharacterized protein n=1 Tax=Nonomuraea fuscirosea TaxID=1291556 RepID=A0A2T0M855_9ACTN|nr:hypothetical protein B0I32_127185 [Nonomuraea fuscirosea]
MTGPDMSVLITVLITVLIRGPVVSAGEAS